MSLGIAIGQGSSLTQILSKRQSVAEGVDTSKSVVELASRLNVEMPICNAVNEILHLGADVDHIVNQLLQRPFGFENQSIDYIRR